MVTAVPSGVAGIATLRVVGARQSPASDDGRPDAVGARRLVDGEQVARLVEHGPGAVARRAERHPVERQPGADRGRRSSASTGHGVEVAHGLGRGEHGVRARGRRAGASRPRRTSRCGCAAGRPTCAPPPSARPRSCGQDADVGARRALDLGPVDAGRVRGRGSTSKRYTVTGRGGRSTSTPWRASSCSRRPADLDGRDHRRDLLDLARSAPAAAARTSAGVTCGHVAGARSPRPTRRASTVAVPSTMSVV